MVLIKSQRKKNQNPSDNDASPSSANHGNQGAKIPQSDKEKNPFDFIQFYQYSKIQISPIDYLKSHPFEIKRLVDHCKGDGINLKHNGTTKEENESLTYNLFDQEESTILATFPSEKPDPFMCHYI